MAWLGDSNLHNARQKSSSEFDDAHKRLYNIESQEGANQVQALSSTDQCPVLFNLRGIPN
jgi:hypothetical protein